AKRYAMATLDGWNYRLIDITEAESPTDLRVTICSGLQITDPEFAQIYLTDVGQLDHEEPLSDTMLTLCKRTKADPTGSLKFFVRSIASPYLSIPSSAGSGVNFGQKIGATRAPLDEATYLQWKAQFERGAGSPP